jgi:hypothetical protein
MGAIVMDRTVGFYTMTRLDTAASVRAPAFPASTAAHARHQAVLEAVMPDRLLIAPHYNRPFPC